MSDLLQNREIDSLSDVIRGLALDGVERVLFAPHALPQAWEAVNYLKSHGLDQGQANAVDSFWFSVAIEAAELGALIGYTLAQNPPGLTDTLEKWLTTAINRAGLDAYQYPEGMMWEYEKPQQEGER